eukprot:868098_1
MNDIATPDQANYEFGDVTIPDNFLDNTLSKAVNQHSRKESQIASVEEDFAKVLDQNVASNIAANLIGYIHDDAGNNSKHIPPDPDEDDVRIGDEEVIDENSYGLDEMLIDAVTAHKHRESRTNFVEQKLHELFPQSEDKNENELLTNLNQKGPVDMSKIASNLVSFLHDEPTPNESNIDSLENNHNSEKKARISADLTDKLNSKVNKL